MPTCKGDNCQKRQSKLNAGDLCTTCFTAVNKNNTGLNDIAGIPISDIDELPDLDNTQLGAPITTGAMLKIITGVVKPMYEKLEDHEKRITVLEDKNNKLEAENVKLNQKVQVAEGKIQNLEKNQEKIKSIMNKQQMYIAKQDKVSRSKNLIISGLAENTPLQYEGQEADTDKEKVDMILDALGKPDTEIAHCRRIGTEDRGHEGRGRFLLIEFKDQRDRNSVRKDANKLNGIEPLKHLRFKADLTKEERDEYKRLYEQKDTLQEANPTENVRVDKGKLYIGDNEVDHIKVSSKVFQ